LAGAYVKLPAMPGTAQDLPRPAVLIRAGHGCRDRGPEYTRTERTSLMGAPVAQGKELATNVEDADGASCHVDELACARRDLGDGRHHIPGHLTGSPTGKGRARCLP